MDPSISKKTQDRLGKIIKKPPLTDKLLGKPPFRFLHDIMTSVIKTTGFMQGLYTETEMNSENVKDKDSKIAFLQKAVDIVAAVTGKSLNVRPVKIVAGHEPERTNEFLQSLADAINKSVDNDEYVRRVLKGDGGKGGKEEKKDRSSKERTKSADRRKPDGDGKGDRENDEEKSKEKGDRDRHASDRGKSRGGERPRDGDRGDRTRDRSRDERHRDRSRKSFPPDSEQKLPQPLLDKKATLTTTASRLKSSQSEIPGSRNKTSSKSVPDNDNNGYSTSSSISSRRVVPKDRVMAIPGIKSRQILSSAPGFDSSPRSLSGSHKTKGSINDQKLSSSSCQGSKIVGKGVLEGREVSERDGRSRLAAKEVKGDLGGVADGKDTDDVVDGGIGLDRGQGDVQYDSIRDQSKEKENESPSRQNGEKDEKSDAPPRLQRPSSAKGSRRRREAQQHAALEDEEFQKEMAPSKEAVIGEGDLPPQISAARQLARPSSARPAPPRPKQEASESEPAMRLGGGQPANVIVDNGIDDEDDDENFLVEESAPPPPELETQPISKPTEEEDTEHGALVKKMLESKKELEGGSQTQQANQTKKTEIERPIMSDAQRRKQREQVQKEVDKLRSSIQSLTRSANPLGKVMDYVQEDLDSMQQELDKWRQDNAQLTLDLKREMNVTDRAVEPLKQQLSELERAISDQLDQIASSKSQIIRNDAKIEKMLKGIAKS